MITIKIITSIFITFFTALCCYGMEKEHMADFTRGTFYVFPELAAHYFKIIEKGDLKALKALVAKNNMIDMRDSAGNTLLHRAAQHGNTEIIQYLLEAKANIHHANFQGKTPLHSAVEYKQEQAVQTLINAKANCAHKDRDDKTAFDTARALKQRKIALLLLAQEMKTSEPIRSKL